MSQFRKPRTVVVVEDDADARDLLIDSFENAGYRVLPAASAGEALRLLRARPSFDLLATELSLPGTTGPELIRAAMEEGLLDAATPLLLYTARAQVSGSRNVALLRKPLDSLMLVRAADRALGAETTTEEVGSIFGQRISSYDFVRALLPAGYRLVGTTFGHALLARHGKELLVPRGCELSDDVVLGLLREAGVSAAQFVELLRRLGSRDTWPESQALDADHAMARKRSP
jgi:CheY-like chemotaxis protein